MPEALREEALRRRRVLEEAVAERHAEALEEFCARSALPDALRRLPEVQDVEVAMAPGGWLLGIALAQEREGLAAVLGEVVGQGGAVHACTVREATLEDVYVRALAGPPAGAETQVLAC